MEIYDLCEELNNFFETDKKFGTFTIENGSIALNFLLSGQYFRIVGSVFNDGVYKYPVSGLTDETFDGAIWAMAIPSNVIALKSQIELWESEYGEKAKNPYQSESFGSHYSYSKASGGTDSAGRITWRSTFKSSLNKWRKIKL